MDSFYLTVNSMGRLAPTLLTLIISVYLLGLRQKTVRTYLLAGYFSFATFFNLGYLFSYSMLDPAGRWGLYLVSLIVIALIFKTRFAYYLPRHRFTREERVVFWITTVMAGGAYLEYVLQSGLATRFYFESQFYGPVFVSTSIPVAGFLIFFWGMIVFIRQTFHGGGVNRAALAFLLLTIVELLLNLVVVLERFDLAPLPDDAIAVWMNAGLLVLFFFYALLYLNLSSEPSSFVVKLVGISMVTLMAVISSLGLHQMVEIEHRYDESRHEDAAAAVERLLTGRSPQPAGEARLSTVSYIVRLARNGPDELVYAREAGLRAPPRPPLTDSEPASLDRNYRHSGERIYLAYRGDQPGDGAAGYEVGFDYVAYRQFIHDHALTYCYAILGSVLFMLMVFPLFFRATVTRPLQQLLNLLKESQAPETAGASPEDELLVLSRSFASMMRLLKDAKNRFYEYSDHIEEVERMIASHGSGETIIREVGDRTLVFASSAMREVIKHVDRFAGFDRPVLVTGETGTGKELIARLIHHAGPRAPRPFIAVNCAAIPASLWEDEIFGHVRGAFTDARVARSGHVAEAGDGTLFFDEIGEMPLEMQAKLLRLLQERNYSPVGSDSPLPAGCRFLFATNRDLAKLIEAGEFREDLYYRINVFQTHIPPLRDRRADIPVLADYILKAICTEAGMDAVEPEAAAIRALVSYSWPGNIRELENVLVQSLALGAHAHDHQLRVKDLPPMVARAATSHRAAPVEFASLTRLADAGGNAAPASDETDSFDELVRRFSRRLIEDALKRSQGNKTRAADILGMKRNRLRYQIKELQIEER